MVELINAACAEAGVSPREIYEITFAGNTTMQHLLCGIDPEQLGQVPFTPVFGGGLLLEAAELEVPIHPRAAAYVFPVVGGFVGGDTVAGMLATGLAGMDGPVLMVDIGTNGEIVLAHGGKLWAASTAAGPAFEGARISCGMRATTGAIEKVVADGDLRLGVIGSRARWTVRQRADRPGGGTAAAGRGLARGAASGLRRVAGSDGPAASPARATGRPGTVGISPGRRQRAAADGASPLTQRDVRELQLATGAIRAGIKIVCKQAGIGSSDLKRVLIAGGFGSFIRRSNAQRIGLLPTDVHHERINYVGNASLDGAKLALLSTEARKRGEELARRVLHVEALARRGLPDGVRRGDDLSGGVGVTGAGCHASAPPQATPLRCFSNRTLEHALFQGIAASPCTRQAQPQRGKSR